MSAAVDGETRSVFEQTFVLHCFCGRYHDVQRTASARLGSSRCTRLRVGLGGIRASHGGPADRAAIGVIASNWQFAPSDIVMPVGQ